MSESKPSNAPPRPSATPILRVEAWEGQDRVISSTSLLIRQGRSTGRILWGSVNISITITENLGKSARYVQVTPGNLDVSIDIDPLPGSYYFEFPGMLRVDGRDCFVAFFITKTLFAAGPVYRVELQVSRPEA